MSDDWRPIPLAVSPDQEVSSDGRIRHVSDHRERAPHIERLTGTPGFNDWERA